MTVDQFLLDQIDTVPHLEALLLLWRQPATPPPAAHWTPTKMGEALFLAPEAARDILDELVRRGLGRSPEPGVYTYAGDRGRDELMIALDLAYRQELIRITRLIHSKPSAAVREFARAFRLRKDGK